MKLKAGKLELSFGKKEISVTHGAGYKQESDVGQVDLQTRWTDRKPHPNNMIKYDDWCNDPEANIAFNVLTGIIAGVGIHTEMPIGEKPEHNNKKIIDKYIDDVNLEEDMQEITLNMLQKGFSPVERLSNYDLKLLPSESFYIWKNKLGHVYRYTQEIPTGNVVAIWEDKDWKKQLESTKSAYKKEAYTELIGWRPSVDSRSYDSAPLDDIILFFYGRTPQWPYGKALVEPIGDLLNERKKMNRDMPKAIHRWAYPIPFLYSSGDATQIKDACTDRDVDEWVFVSNVDKDDTWMETVTIDPQARFIPYIEMIYSQICEGLHAPLLLYLKNATEASATVMMESVDRLVNGIQMYEKKRIEKYLFMPQVSSPCPVMRWGQPKTGLEDVTFTDLSSVLQYLPKNQQQFIIKKYIPDLPEPIKDPEPILPFGGAMQKDDQKPAAPNMKQMQQMVERLNDIDTGLKVIETNFREGRLGVADACRLADQTITVHMKRLHGEAWISYRDEAFSEFVAKKLLKVNKETYTVQVD